MLVHEGQPQLAELAGRQRQRHLAAVERQPRAGLGRVEPGQDLDQGGLARAVLSEQAVHLAAPDAEGDAIECDGAAEALAQVADFERRLRRDRPSHQCRSR